MCLTLSRFRKAPVLAKEDVYSYKVFILKNDKLYTPFRDVPMCLDILYYSTFSFGYDLSINRTKLCVEKGYHSFANLKDCYELYDEIAAGGETPVIYKCRIPKMSTYFKGTFEGKKSYASQYIIVKEYVPVNRK